MAKEIAEEAWELVELELLGRMITSLLLVIDYWLGLKMNNLELWKMRLSVLEEMSQDNGGPSSDTGS